MAAVAFADQLAQSHAILRALGLYQPGFNYSEACYTAAEFFGYGIVTDEIAAQAGWNPAGWIAGAAGLATTVIGAVQMYQECAPQ